MSGKEGIVRDEKGRREEGEEVVSPSKPSKKPASSLTLMSPRNAPRSSAIILTTSS